jgi:nitric oxide reductase subunit B
MKSVKLRAVLLFILGLCFGVLIFGGYMIKKEKPPIPDTVKSVSGEVLFTGKDIMAGQNYYFSRGGSI